MRFHLVDRIVAVEPGKSLRAVKHLTLGEEYLADHFPTFPVMPGVLQLQTLVEAGAWLLRLTDDYARSVWVLREAKNVKYGTFMPPGRRMDVAVELVKRDGDTATLTRQRRGGRRRRRSPPSSSWPATTCRDRHPSRGRPRRPAGAALKAPAPRCCCGESIDAATPEGRSHDCSRTKPPW